MTGETACPTELHQQFAPVVGQAFSLSRAGAAIADLNDAAELSRVENFVGAEKNAAMLVNSAGIGDLPPLAESDITEWTG